MMCLVRRPIPGPPPLRPSLADIPTPPTFAASTRTRPAASCATRSSPTSSRRSPFTRPSTASATSRGACELLDTYRARASRPSLILLALAPCPPPASSGPACSTLPSACGARSARAARPTSQRSCSTRAASWRSALPSRAWRTGAASGCSCRCRPSAASSGTRCVAPLARVAPRTRSALSEATFVPRRTVHDHVCARGAFRRRIGSAPEHALTCTTIVLFARTPTSRSTSARSATSPRRSARSSARRPSSRPT